MLWGLPPLPARRDNTSHLSDIARLQYIVRHGGCKPNERKSFRLAPRVASVPIQYVLTHTSGIQPDLDSLAFKPGSNWEYSNFGFYVLGRALEHLCRLPLDRCFQTLLFDKAGMHRTVILRTAQLVDSIPPNYMQDFDSAGLAFKKNSLVQTIAGSGAGNFFTTASDLFRFAEALRTNELISRASVERMRTPDPALGASDYGFGVVRWRGPTTWGHTGGLPGVEADIELYGDSGYVLIALTNLDGGGNGPIRRKAAALLTGRSAFGAVVIP